MQTNNSFSFPRFVLLCKQSLIINKKLIGITLAGVIGTMVIVLIFFQSMSNFRNYENKSYEVLFVFLFVVWGVIYSGLSFPAFRSKEKSINYLMLPVTTSEKFAFELLTRIVIYILFMPLLFWAVANLEGAIVREFVPEFPNYKFSFRGVNNSSLEYVGRIYYIMIQGVLFLFIAAFAGASHFSKSPLLKTLFSLAIIVGGYALFSYLLFKSLNISGYQSGRYVFHMDQDDTINFGAIAATVINLCLLAFAWFRLKEKEV